VKRADTVPPAAREVFVTGLKAESRHAAALPDPLPMGRVLRVVDKSVETEQQLEVLAGQDDKGYYLDFYRIDTDRDGETYWHGRVRDTGVYEDLENFEGQWGTKVFPSEPEKTAAEQERVQAVNTNVDGILRKKGFR
jgi:hypothetical protein